MVKETPSPQEDNLEIKTAEEITGILKDGGEAVRSITPWGESVTLYDKDKKPVAVDAKLLDTTLNQLKKDRKLSFGGSGDLFNRARMWARYSETGQLEEDWPKSSGAV